ncbi:hypothetical protein [Methylosinus sp. Sm6]|uniref:hypothetical protein n=1 Tax=Methylosinus sp. Sm6 TaxID=2866948 RepID=UPI001C99C162|nr:hypothetical protein [Methylosinus sp. Sm6]MBY6240043.1 hypothetical protein [Methylosinus sp. Sm6]
MNYGAALTRPKSQEQIAVTTFAQAIFAAMDARGIPSPLPADTLGTVMNERMKAISPEQLASIRPGDSNLTAIVSRSMDTALSGFSDAQKKAMQPSRDPQNGGDRAGANADFFKQDAFGRIGWDRKIGAVGGAYAANNGGSSYGYAGMVSRWDPSTGGAGLNEKNFPETPFQHAGLDLGTTRSLFAKGFNQQQILAAANDTKALGFSPHDKAAVEDHATIRKLAHNPDEINNHLRGLDASLRNNKEYQGLVDQLHHAKTEEERRRIREQLKKIEQKAADENHVTHDKHDTKNPHKVHEAVGRREKELYKKWRHEEKLTLQQNKAETQQGTNEHHARRAADTKVEKNEALLAALQKQQQEQHADAPESTPPTPQNKQASAQPPAQGKPTHSAALRKPTNPTV